MGKTPRAKNEIALMFATTTTTTAAIPTATIAAAARHSTTTDAVYRISTENKIRPSASSLQTPKSYNSHLSTVDIFLKKRKSNLNPPPPTHKTNSQHHPNSCSCIAYPVPPGVGRSMPPLGHGTTAATTTTTTTTPCRSQAKRRHERQSRPGRDGGGVVCGRPRSVTRTLGGTVALGAPPRGEVDHVIELVRRAKSRALPFVPISRPLQAPGLRAAGVLKTQK